jgi:hypothetical protein
VIEPYLSSLIENFAATRETFDRYQESTTMRRVKPSLNRWPKVFIAFDTSES